MKLEFISIRQTRYELAFLTVCIATAILTTSAISALPLYLDSTESLGLARMMKSLPPSGTGAWVQAREVAFNPGAINATMQALGEAEVALGELAGGKTVFVRSGMLTAHELGSNVGPIPGAWHYQSIPDDMPQVEFVDGNEPNDGSGVQVAIAATTAEALGISVGDRFTLTVPPTDIVHSVATVVGMFAPVDRESEYWQGLYGTLMDPRDLATSGTPPTLALVHDATLRRLASESVADLGEVWGIYYTDSESLTRLGVGSSLRAIDRFSDSVSRSLPSAVSVANIRSALEGVQRQLSFAQVSTRLTGSLVLSLLIFVLFALARTVTNGRDIDRARLEARGANRKQVGKIFVTHGVVLLVAPTAIGPILSAAAMPLLGRTGGFVEVSGGALLPWRLTFEQFALAGAVAVGATVYYFLPAFATRVGPVVSTALSGRRGFRPWIWRANLDMVAIVAALALIYDANSQGGIVDTDGSVSTVSVALPVAASVVIALLGLRALSTVGGTLGKLSGLRTLSKTGITFVVFGRSVMNHATATLIAGGMMVIAIISLGLHTTVVTNAMDRASFSSVADIRLTKVNGNLGLANLEVQRINDLEWVNETAWGVRTHGRAGLTDQSPRFNLLSVQPEPISRIAWFRDDFAHSDLDNLMSAITDYAKPDGLPVHDGATELVLEAQIKHEGSGRIDLWARVSDSAGKTHTLLMDRTSPAPTSQDVYLFGSAIKPDVPRPIRLVSVMVYEPPVSPLGTPLELHLHSLVSVSQDGSIVLVSEFNDASVWHPISSSLRGNVAIKSVSNALDDTSTLRVVMGRGTDDGLRGIYFSSHGPVDVPLLVNNHFMRGTGLAVGDSFTGHTLGRFVPFAIRGSYELFPSQTSVNEPNAVANVDALLSYVAPVSEPFLGSTAELIASVRGDITSAQRRNDIKAVRHAIGIVDRTELMEGSDGELASAAGLRYVSIATGTIGVAVGCMALFAIGVRFVSDGARDRALMEAIGASRGFNKLDGVLRLAMPVVFGLTIGAISGTYGVAWLVSNMTRASDGSVAVPPLLLDVPWPVLALIAILIVMVAVVPSVFDGFSGRRSIASRLRSVVPM